MSYCILGDNSDVYVYDNFLGTFSVICAYKGDGVYRNVKSSSRTMTICYLNFLRTQGYKVPREAIIELKNELNPRVRATILNLGIKQ